MISVKDMVLLHHFSESALVWDIMMIAQNVASLSCSNNQKGQQPHLAMSRGET